MFSLSRSLFSINSMFVDKYKIEDQRYDGMIQKLQVTTESFKKVVSMIENLPQHMNIFMSNHAQIFQTLTGCIEMTTEKDEECLKQLKEEIN